MPIKRVKVQAEGTFCRPCACIWGPERRKTGWMRAEAAGDPGPWRQQAILGRGRWEADALRDVVREYALEALADPGAASQLR